HADQQRQLAVEKPCADRELRGCRFVVGGRASGRCRDEGPPQDETVARSRRRRLAGEACSMERRVEPVARIVTGEHAAGSVRPMGRRRETPDQNTRLRITETRNGPTPIRLIAEGAALGPCDSLAMAPQPWAS